jgi:MOSC domain-containing protein YiiM
MRYQNGKYVRESTLDRRQGRSILQSHSWTTEQDLPCGRLRLVAYSPHPGVEWQLSWQETSKRSLDRAFGEVIRKLEGSVEELKALMDAADDEAAWKKREQELQWERWRRENISTAGLTEAEVAVGDTFRLGDALIQVSQGRQPCWKLNHRFGVADMARRVQQAGRTGWYYRVLQTGTVTPGDRLELIDRLAPDWTLRRLWHALYVDRMNLVELEGIAELDVLAEGWRKYALRRLESRRVEDWSARLDGSA